MKEGCPTGGRGRQRIGHHFSRGQAQQVAVRRLGRVRLTSGRNVESAAASRDGLQPAGQGIEVVRPIRDEIERRVRALLAQLAVA